MAHIDYNTAYYLFFPHVLNQTPMALSAGSGTDTELFVRPTPLSEESVTLYGSGFTYDADGILVAGTITRISVVDAVYDGPSSRSEITDITWDVPAFLSAQAQGIASNRYTEYATLFGPVLSIDASGSAGWFDMDIFSNPFWGELARAATGGVTLTGADSGNFAYGHSGDDALLGGDGGDQLFGYAGNDTLDGGAGNDRLRGGTGNDLILGGAGNDRIHDTVGDDTIDGGDDYDVVSLSGAPATDSYLSLPYWFQRSSDDIIVHLGGQRIVLRDIEEITMSSSFQTPEVLLVSDLVFGVLTLSEAGTSGADTMQGGVGNDSLWGMGGDDLLLGGAGNDVLIGDSGNDTLDGGIGDDVLRANNRPVAGPNGDNVLLGGAGHDILVGAEANDTLRGGDGNDALQGGDGYNKLHGDGGDDQIRGGAGRDEVTGGTGNDVIDLGAGNDLAYGQDGNDTLAGGFGTDELHGQDGADMMSGGAFSDLLTGGAGDDFINGGFGHDRINGGNGTDTFYHLGIFDHGSDWVQDYTEIEGDVLHFGDRSVSADDFQVNFTETDGAGDAGVAEAFVIYSPTGQIIWALVDGAGQDEINLRIGDEMFDLLG